MTSNPSEAEGIAELFRVIGHSSRINILLALAAGEHGVGALDQATDIGQPALSQQLAILRKAELVVTRREAKQVFYSLNPAKMRLARDTLDRLCSAADATHAVVPIAASSGPVGAAMFARVQART